MSDEIISSSLEDGNASNDGKKRFTYPGKDLNSIIDFVAKVYNHFGHTNYNSNKAIATVHGLSPDSIKTHLSSSQQYGLFELKHGTGYKVTDHFLKIYLPKTEKEKRDAVIHSLKLPEVYQQLFKDYEYHVVPIEGVKNHFIRAYGFKEDIASKAAAVFIENLKNFDLIDNRGVLTSGLPFKEIGKLEETDFELGKGDEKNENNNGQTGQELGVPAVKKIDRLIFQSEIEAAGKKTIPIYLIGNKQALFVYPDDITEDDIELVKHQIDGVLLRIKLESRKKEAQ